jgi:cell division protein FtsB
MRSFQQKRGFKNVLNSRPVLVFLGVLVVFFAFGVIGFMGKLQLTEANRKNAENKVAELEKEKSTLTSDIAKLETKSGIEESIREKFGLAREGEKMIIIVDDKTLPKVPESPLQGFFSIFKNWFK